MSRVFEKLSGIIADLFCAIKNWENTPQCHEYKKYFFRVCNFCIFVCFLVEYCGVIKQAAVLYVQSVKDQM